MSDEVVWEDPPAKKIGPGSSVWADRLAPFVERPGEWGCLPDVKRSIAASFMANARRGDRKLPFGTTIDQWEYRTSEGRVFFRFNGESLRKVAG